MLILIYHILLLLIYNKKVVIMVNIIQFIEQCATRIERKIVSLNEEQRIENELAAVGVHI